MSGLYFGGLLLITLVSVWSSNSVVTTPNHGYWFGCVIIVGSAAFLWGYGPNPVAFGALLGSGWAFLNEISETVFT